MKATINELRLIPKDTVVWSIPLQQSVKDV